MRLSSVNVGRVRPIANAKASGKTGIYKQPVSSPVGITRSGVDGDNICDVENHGGVDQAVYIFGVSDYDWWSEALGRELSPGTFGENLTVAGLESGRSCIGDRLAVGSVVLEVTAPRIPCVTLAARMGDPSFVKRFRQAERPGLYCRVVREGKVQTGDSVTLQRPREAAVPAIEIFRDFFDPAPGEGTLRRHLAAPIAVRARVTKEKQLGELLAAKDGGFDRLLDGA